MYIPIVFVSLAGGLLQGGEPALAIVSAGVQRSDDAPFVSTDYQFLPGDFVYVTFQIGGFGVKTDEEKGVRSISLTYSISVADSHETPLATPVSGEIKTELSPEDKNWTPKRRASFLLPSFVAAGDFHVHLAVKDLIAKSEAMKEIPFHIGGVRLQPAATITIQNLQFSREENGEHPLDVAAYRPGDTVYIAFDMAGFQLDPGNKYHVAYGVKVLRPDAKPFLDRANAAQMESSSFYPAQFVPGTLDIATSRTSPKGEYVVILTARDLIGNQTFSLKQAFRLE
jgi:hypothetical protein